MIAEVTATVAKDVDVTVAKEITSFVGAEIAASILPEIARSLTVRLGVSGGVLGVGASSTVATLGIGLLAGILTDTTLDWLLQQAGYDPEAEIADEVARSLDRLELLILEGPSPSDFTAADRVRPNPYSDEYAGLGIRQGGTEVDRETVEATFNKFRAAQNKADAAQAVDKIPGCLGMRYQLQHLHKVRARLREAALKRLILEGGAK